MNKTFKTIWNEARRSYVVTNEAQKSHGKPSKCAVVLAVAATAFLSMGVAQAAYIEPGFVASNDKNKAEAVQSWETAEYKADWGLAAMNASSAYALGYHGQGVAVGVMDSGALLQKHPELAGDRFHASSADAHYGSTGDRYPQSDDDRDTMKPVVLLQKVELLMGTGLPEQTTVTVLMSAERSVRIVMEASSMV